MLRTQCQIIQTGCEHVGGTFCPQFDELNLRDSWFQQDWATAPHFKVILVSPHLNLGQFGVPSLLPRFGLFWFFFLVGGLIYIVYAYCWYILFMPRRPKGKHPNCNSFLLIFCKGTWQTPILEGYSVYKQWKASPPWHDFQNIRCVTTT